MTSLNIAQRRLRTSRSGKACLGFKTFSLTAVHASFLSLFFSVRVIPFSAVTVICMIRLILGYILQAVEDEEVRAALLKEVKKQEVRLLKDCFSE